MHRDIKGGNLLLTKDGVLKIADFGLAREFKRVNSIQFTVKVVTRWYRAPELLLGVSNYKESIDIWSIGCFVAEMFIGKPLFPGRSDLEQLPTIYDKLGVPDDSVYQGITHCKGYNESVNEFNKLKNQNPNFGSKNLATYLREIRNSSIEDNNSADSLVRHMDEDAIDLIA